MKRYTAWMALLLAALLCLMPLAARAAARMPEERGSVTDDADVLSAGTVKDLESYFEKVEDETDIDLHVAIVHFLDGLDAQTYADELFTKWDLGEEDMLLLGAAGEDSFATAMGQEVQRTLGKTNAENLMFTSSQFSALFRAQRYDEAFAAYCTAFNALLTKQTDADIRMNGLFGQTSAQTERVNRNYGSELWDEVMESITESSVDYQNYHQERQHEENGLTAGGWLVLLILIFIVFRQDKSQRRYRGERKGCLGWLLSILGINVLWNVLRGRRR